ncbi:hypothetical protein [Rheinheimera sp.]|jgi:uncharacterized membrane protein YozB (DUF420 family)|uniref:hypothetical protein n=1 Tax=Rheinheimera sp. TaxID=1869214 RepID=UPI004048A805
MHTTANQPSRANSDISSNSSVFFSRLALFITVVVFGGFILNWIVNPGQFERLTLWIGLHGSFSAAWYLLLLNQLHLSRSGNIAAHRRWGKLSVALFIAILFTGVMMTLGLYERLVGFGVFDPSDASARVMAGGLIGGTFLQWAIFGILYVLGVLNVRAPAHHKRFMLAAAIQMMPEGLNRLTHALALPGSSMLVIMLLVYSSIMMYDWKTDRRLHWSTLVSLALFIFLAASIYTVFRTQAWGDWVVHVLSGTY